MKHLFTFCICISVIACKGQINYASLYDRSIEFKELHDSVISISDIGSNTFSLFEITDSIYYYTSDLLQDQNTSPIVPTYIKIYNDTFDLKPMFSNDSSLSYGVSLVDGFFFNYEEEDFILLFFRNANASCHWCENLTLLFNISDKKEVILSFMGFQKESEPNILGMVKSSLVLYPIENFSRSVTPLWYHKSTKIFDAKQEYSIAIDINSKSYEMSINKGNSKWPFFTQ